MLYIVCVICNYIHINTQVCFWTFRYINTCKSMAIMAITWCQILMKLRLQILFNLLCMYYLYKHLFIHIHNIYVNKYISGVPIYGWYLYVYKCTFSFIHSNFIGTVAHKSYRHHSFCLNVNIIHKNCFAYYISFNLYCTLWTILLTSSDTSSNFSFKFCIWLPPFFLEN